MFSSFICPKDAPPSADPTCRAKILSHRSKLGQDMAKALTVGAPQLELVREIALPRQPPLEILMIAKLVDNLRCGIVSRG
ncbi:hypothetical protein [Mesorhizobium sp. BH1-1-4]|uniref:hypothetical protein n=1 Tax=Mesorhizobium sp. BH1-1-4 TaxID=2876662 RepID=UPI001CD188F4|nr:hypothetical protein [Mesorhizobium sp. BH1-1-4]MBZ9994372.1 hypothetical protein [Mesorhizobium sp. BH1-1-4]